jgi:hypothetical protein
MGSTALRVGLFILIRRVTADHAAETALQHYIASAFGSHHVCHMHRLCCAKI